MIELKNIKKTYQTGKISFEALSGIDLTIESGEFVAIMGPSGSGKSTLLHILGFLDKADFGSYTIYGKEITKLKTNELAILRNNLAGFVFQQFHLLPRINVLENTELPLIYAGKRHLKEKAKEKIKEVGLSLREKHNPNELSGGEQQRVAIARCLVNDPLIIFADEPTGNLDTKSEEEIISILEKLNQEGKTIVMVTHENEIAEHAKRIIRMRDGKIISDEKINANIKTNQQQTSNISIDNILAASFNSTKKAEFIDHFRQAIRSIFSNKLRSILSMLGILIGVSAVIAMLALGNGAKSSIEQRLASLGSNLLTIRPGSHRSQGVSMESGAVTRFTLQDAKALSRLSQVKYVSPSVRGRAQIVYGNKNWNTQLQGTGANYAEMRAAIPPIGRFFIEQELSMRQKVVVLGNTVATELFGDTNPIGSIVRINRINFKVIGILPEKGANAWRDEDDLVIVPITTAMYRLLGKEYVDSIDVEILNSSLMEKAQNVISDLIVKRHNLGNNKNKESAFEIRNMAEIQETLESTTQTLTLLLGFIAGISLIVGGIGIMNIMLVSVTERTREIGLRKAIGAQAKDIMLQFLIESIVMTFSGGIIGIIFGIVAAMSLSIFADWPTKISSFSVILVTLFSIAVGVGFGLWPAHKASKLDPIEALRYE